MNKGKDRIRGGLYGMGKVFLVIGVLMFCSCSISNDDKKNESKKEMIINPNSRSLGKAVENPDKMPSFQKRSCLQDYISENLNCPESSVGEGVDKVVYVTFIVTKEGSVEQVEAITNPHPKLVKSAIDVVEDMPDWEPASKNGKNVPVRINIPIRFYQ